MAIMLISIDYNMATFKLKQIFMYVGIITEGFDLGYFNHF